MLPTIMLVAFLSISLVDATIPIIPRALGADSDATYTLYYFDQLIDHNNPHVGTSQQRYWMSLEFYKIGSPIVLTTPGQINAETYTSYLTNKTINGMIAQHEHGATILLEHRFFGYSVPYDNLTTQSLEFLTVQQTIDDLAYFAQNVHLPIPGGDEVKPDTMPWVLVCGSYAGKCIGSIDHGKPGVFHAGFASSAVVEAITDFYDFWTPIQEYMPQNCSSDVQAVIAYLDQIYAEDNVAAMQSSKETFRLGGLSHIDDFAAALQNNLISWQDLQSKVGSGAMFFKFCDALEVKDGINAPATGWGLDHAINSWGFFWNNTFYTYYCKTMDVEACLGSYTSVGPWTDISVNNDARSWTWMVCNELGFFQDGPPLGRPTIASRIVRPIYWERQCVNVFPQKFSYPPSPSTDKINKQYGGWNISVDRLLFSDGRRGPYLSATVSAEGLFKANTTTQPIYKSDALP